MMFIKDPTEQTTAATDILLAIVAFGGILFLQWPISHTGGLWKIKIWSAALGLIGMAGALGAVAHGFFLSPTIHHRIWLVLNMALALAVSLFVVVVAHDLWGFEVSLITLPITLIAGFGFYIGTLFHPGIFFLFIVYEALSLFFALSAYVYLTIRTELHGAGLMAAGILVSIIAAGIQANKSITLTIIWKFDHNGIYHLVQAVGLLFLIYGIHRSML